MVRRLLTWFRRGDGLVVNSMHGVGPLMCPHCGGEITPFTVKVVRECAAMCDTMAKVLRTRADKLEKDE